MPVFSDAERVLARAVSALQDANPFLPERLDLEREALGDEFVATDAVWHRSEHFALREQNLEALASRVESLAIRARKILAKGGARSRREAGAGDLALYEDLVLYHVYHRYQSSFHGLIERRGAATSRIGFYDDFRDDVCFFLGPDVLGSELARTGTADGDPDGATDLGVRPHDPAHLFALSFQIRRAFHHAIRYILGGSMPAARLRAAVWQSIFSHDMRRYRRLLYRRMGEFTTLITGPSGTGKELVAQAIGRSRYVPFDGTKKTFVDDPEESFYPLNLSALSPTLIESELFGHRKGSFTGAVSDRAGWLEVCSRHGAVFLDEIGEVDPAIQVKLLRLLQSRTYQRLGESVDRRFDGKVIAATNRDLDHEIAEGRFREDFYYRLCADRIVTPSLSQQLDGATDELGRLLELLAERMVGAEEAGVLAAESLDWIQNGLPVGYEWPGNVRELEQCVRNVLIRREYHPHGATPVELDPSRELARDLRSITLSADELLSYYCTFVYSRCGSYSETGRMIGLDRRTIRARIVPELLDRWTLGSAATDRQDDEAEEEDGVEE